MGAVFASRRRPFEATLIRQTSAPYVVEQEGGIAVIRNQYLVHVVNKTPQMSSFEIRATVPEGATALLPIPVVALESLSDQRLPLVISMPQARYQDEGTFDIVVQTRDQTTGFIVTSQLRFLGP